MLKYIENLYDVKVKRKNVCYIKNGVMYGKWPFPTTQGGWNLTYASKVNKAVLKEVLLETENYKTVLLAEEDNLNKKYPADLKKIEKNIVYGLEREKAFDVQNELPMKIVQTKEDLILWGKVASQIYTHVDTDFIFESFKTDLKKKYATYFIFYKGKQPVGVSQVIRGAGYSAVYWVGVLEKYRKQGIGAALTQQTLNYEIAHKHTKFLLTASKLGLKIYKRLGFKPMETFYEYELKKHL